MVNYFWDSYAIIELLDGNKKYAKYSQEPIVLSIFNLVEIYKSFLDEYDGAKADELYNEFRENVVDIDDKILKQAVKFRNQQKKRNISYADSIGYIYAKRYNMKFLTGDKEFENFENVEFVK